MGPLKYCIFVAMTPNFMKWMNALLNSIEKRKLFRDIHLTVFVLHYDGCNRDFLRDIQNHFSFEVIPIEIKRGELPAPEGTNRTELIKRARFFYIRKYAAEYDVACLLDCDMFIVSPDFIKLFDLVQGTKLLIGCNERFKWQAGKNYMYSDGQPIFEHSQKLYHFTCSVPIIFEYWAWQDVFNHYCKICYDGRQNKNGKIVGIGDIFCWNISVQKCNKQNDVIVFPMETMCQVHKRHLNPLTFIQVENDYWYSYSGDPVYSIQGRWNTNETFIEGSLRYLREHVDEKTYNAFAGKIKKGLIAIQQEWYDLNFNSILKIGDYEEIKPFWKTFNRREQSD